jgi:hypothetical protein
MSNLRRSVIEAAESAYHEDKISRRQLRQIRLGTLSAKCMARVEAFCREEAVFDGVDSNAVMGDGFDWSTLLKKLIEWLPEILKLISLFMSEAE